MERMREHCVAQVFMLLLLSAASQVFAKAPLSDSPQPTGGKPIPCEEIQVNGATTTYNRCDYRPGVVAPESGVRQFFSAFGAQLHIDGAKLRTVTIKSGLTGINLRFEQVYENRRVFGSEVVVTSDSDGRIRKIRSSYFPIERVLGNGAPTVSAVAAEAVGLVAIGKSGGVLPKLRQSTRSELIWFPVAGTGVALLAWELMIFGQTPFLGDYLTLVDANSGVLLHQEDRLVMGN